MDVRQKDTKQLITIEMKLFRRTAGCTLLDSKRNEEIVEELNVEPVGKKLRRYKSNCLRFATRLNSSRMARGKLNCRAKGRRRLGRL